MDKLNQWLTLIANIGVLIGIVFLAFELRQTTDSLAAQSILELNLANNAEMALIASDASMAEIEVKAKDGIEGLTPIELERYKWNWFSTFNTFESAYIFRQKGIISDIEYATYYNATCRSLRSPGVVGLIQTGEIDFNENFMEVLMNCDGAPKDLFNHLNQ